MKKVDFIIVGNGIAGSIMALHLKAHKKTFKIFSECSLSNSSTIAAGMWNPIVFKRITKSWMADELIDYMQTFYQSFEKIAGKSFYNNLPIIRQFSQTKEIEDWEIQRLKPGFRNYLGDFMQPELLNKNIHPKMGGAFVNKAGFVDVPIFLNETVLHLENEIINQKFIYKNINFEGEEIIYENISANHCIFAEGWLIKDNPYFAYLPMVPAKGEIFTIKSVGLNLNEIANAGCFVLPLGNDLYRVGSTYNWKDLDEIPTIEAKDELVKKLENIIKTPYQIVNHFAGVRPSVKDRRPVLGRHPVHPNLSVFNGMGTKAIMLAPYFANHLIDHLVNNMQLNPEVDISRFQSMIGIYN